MAFESIFRYADMTTTTTISSDGISAVFSWTKELIFDVFGTAGLRGVRDMYQQLLAVIEELGKDIRPTYTGNKICAERLKRSIAHSRILVRECLIEAEKDRQKAAADAAVKNQ
ncbi:hypothetical protein Q1695_009843 [Nippostrongylus brasiliensis]|nr:hypothetical protein Q1695_009843 [Nippostrongylus brasiliensis]